MNNVIRLQDKRGGVGTNLPGAAVCRGRYEIVSASLDPDLAFIGSDPYNTSDFTGVIVPAVPSSFLGTGQRYLFMLARAQFSSGQEGVHLVGVRLYADLVARVPQEDAPTLVFHKEITHPMFHPPDGNISFHVMVLDKTWRDRRNAFNADTRTFQDSFSPSLLFQTPEAAGYTPPNGGRAWGTPLDASLGNIHELRWPWRDSKIEHTLRVPIPIPSDIAIFASVRQNDPAMNPSAAGLSAQQFAALDPEEQFLTSFFTVAQYGRISASLVFEGDSFLYGSEGCKSEDSREKCR